MDDKANDLYKTGKANDLYALKTSFAAMSFPRPAGWASTKSLSKDLKRQQIDISKHSNLTTLQNSFIIWGESNLDNSCVEITRSEIVLIVDYVYNVFTFYVAFFCLHCL